MKLWKDMDEIKAANKLMGKHFFDAAAMRFFDSKVLPTVYGGRYFVTSEQFDPLSGPKWPRKYTIRMATDDGGIKTIGPFNKLESATLARQLIRAHLAEKATSPSSNGNALEAWEALVASKV